MNTCSYILLYESALKKSALRKKILKNFFVDPAAFVQQAGIAIADDLRRDTKHLSNFVVCHLQSVAKTEKIFFGVGQSTEDIKQLPIFLHD